MNIVLYTSSIDKKIEKRLLDKITSDFSCEEIEVYNNIADFKRKIYSFPRKMDVVIVLALENSQLSDLLQYKDALDGLEIILILPDQNKDTVSKAMCFYPRFLAYTDSNFGDVSEVLVKLRIKRGYGNTHANKHVA